MLQLTGKPLEICPEHCQWMEIEIDTTCMYADGECYCRQDAPVCKHESVCQHAFDLGRKSREGGAE